MASDNEVLKVDHLKTYFYMKDDKVAKAVDDVSFTIKRGETVALVGESGSGKSMTALSVMQLIKKPGKIAGGDIYLENESLTQFSKKEIERVRGKDIGMIFQEPMTALNPVFTIGNQMIEMIVKHKKVSKKEAKLKAIELLNLVGISRPEQIIKDYPHQLSGGMRQRVMIAIAISCEPKLLIADEPTTALDVTIQLQILKLLFDLQKKFNMAILFITHDLGVVSEHADRVMVMYGGQIVEEAATKEVLFDTKHPYTEGLLNSLPHMHKPVKRLQAIEGTIPPAYDFPKGCRFAPRCPYAMDACREGPIPLYEAADDHLSRCILHKEGGEHHDS
ncbi:Oligopeptide transport ATP-binding protein [Lentibacillus sp. JNUCC-1]|uniref:ABC transporter ATP-binding protein n=1 Tax=Lentibacillus sp. JNUCC-1 TaxID=2654513 RepID=UPI0012E954F4|nr:ABC transporter ATP-binding protein [Lentibacillus sp. JNUCC-1]MUV37246.1 Oligopeptide transport ATP-binding protein [Lentibacillus sp. JNUCC-1]